MWRGSVADNGHLEVVRRSVGRGCPLGTVREAFALGRSVRSLRQVGKPRGEGAARRRVGLGPTPIERVYVTSGETSETAKLCRLGFRTWLVTTPLSTRKRVGDVVEPFTLETLSHGTIDVPAGAFTHLQFRRFAGCPVCNLHLRSFARGVNELKAANVHTIAFFSSDREAMLPYQGDLPFSVVPDPTRRWYGVFGVENSGLSMVHPSAMWAAFKGMAAVRSNPLQKGEHDGLPADFLLDERGVIVAVKYGSHANDQWSLDEVIALARSRGR